MLRNWCSLGSSSDSRAIYDSLSLPPIKGSQSVCVYKANTQEQSKLVGKKNIV